MSVRCYAIGCIQTSTVRLCYMSQLINSWSICKARSLAESVVLQSNH